MTPYESDPRLVWLKNTGKSIWPFMWRGVEDPTIQRMGGGVPGRAGSRGGRWRDVVTAEDESHNSTRGIRAHGYLRMIQEASRSCVLHTASDSYTCVHTYLVILQRCNDSARRYVAQALRRLGFVRHPESHKSDPTRMVSHRNRQACT